jgi:transcriptional regulator of acetoin/glycerol metabolism
MPRIPPGRICKKLNAPGDEILSLSQSFKEIIESTLRRCRGNVSMASQELSIARSTLYREMQEFGLSK